MRRNNSQHGMIGVCCMSTLFSLTVPGCIAHGDYIRLCEFRGTLIDAASSEPVAEAQFQLSTATTSQETPRWRYQSTTDRDGGFAVRVTIGGGSITWGLFIPIAGRESRNAPDAIHIELEKDSRLVRLEISLTADVREQIRQGEEVIELGELEMSWSPDSEQARE